MIRTRREGLGGGAMTLSYGRIDTLCTFGSMRNRNTSKCLVGDADTGVMLGLPHHVMQLPYPYPSTKRVSVTIATSTIQ